MLDIAEDVFLWDFSLQILHIASAFVHKYTRFIISVWQHITDLQKSYKHMNALKNTHVLNICFRNPDHWLKFTTKVMGIPPTS